MLGRIRPPPRNLQRCSKKYFHRRFRKGLSPTGTESRPRQRDHCNRTSCSFRFAPAGEMNCEGCRRSEHQKLLAWWCCMQGTGFSPRGTAADRPRSGGCTSAAVSRALSGHMFCGVSLIGWPNLACGCYGLFRTHSHTCAIPAAVISCPN